MQAYSPRIIAISIALAIACGLVWGAFVLSGPGSFFGVKRVTAESTEELLRAYAAKDSDSDGLPDWQESLYGTDPGRSDTDEDGVTDGEAAQRGLLSPRVVAEGPAPDPVSDADIPGQAPAPGSITDQFARIFLERFVAAGGGGQVSPEQQQALINDLLLELGTKTGATLTSTYSPVSIRTSAQTSVSSYTEALALILIEHDVPAGEGDPMLLMQAYLEQGDASAQQKLERLGKTYSAITQALVQTSVPLELADEHLMLVQSFDTLARATAVVVDYEEDPLAVMGALSVYQPSSEQAVAAFKGIAAVVLRSGEPAPDTGDSFIVRIARSAETP